MGASLFALVSGNAKGKKDKYRTRLITAIENCIALGGMDRSLEARDEEHCLLQRCCPRDERYHVSHFHGFPQQSYSSFYRNESVAFIQSSKPPWYLESAHLTYSGFLVLAFISTCASNPS